MLEPDEVAEAVPDSDKTLSVSAFIGCSDIDDVYFDKPYYLTPSDRHAEEAFALIREGMRKKKVAAIAQTVLFRRVRTLLIRAYDKGFIATTLNFDYEVRSAKEAFDDIPEMKIEGEMLELAEHIITTKRARSIPPNSMTATRQRLPSWSRPSSRARRSRPPRSRSATRLSI